MGRLSWVAQGSAAPVWAGSWTTAFPCCPESRVASGVAVSPTGLPRGQASGPLDVSVGARWWDVGRDVSGSCS